MHYYLGTWLHSIYSGSELVLVKSIETNELVEAEQVVTTFVNSLPSD